MLRSLGVGGFSASPTHFRTPTWFTEEKMLWALVVPGLSQYVLVQYSTEVSQSLESGWNVLMGTYSTVECQEIQMRKRLLGTDYT